MNDLGHGAAFIATAGGGVVLQDDHIRGQVTRGDVGCVTVLAIEAIGQDANDAARAIDAEGRPRRVGGLRRIALAGDGAGQGGGDGGPGEFQLGDGFEFSESLQGYPGRDQAPGDASDHAIERLDVTGKLFRAVRRDGINQDLIFGVDRGERLPRDKGFREHRLIEDAGLKSGVLRHQRFQP